MTGRSAGIARVGVARADDLSAPDATTGQGNAPDSRPVIAAAGGIDAWCPAELARGEHERRFEPSRALQVVQEGSVGPIEGRQ